jgi:5-methylcytosine-specific restriction endonuclease McrA
MQSFTKPGQTFQGHVLNFNGNKFQSSWQQECLYCGAIISMSPLQYVHEVDSVHTRGQAYARISTACTRCNEQMTEMWSIN